MSLITSRVRLAALAAAAGLLLVGLTASPASAEELPDQPDTSVSVPADESEPTPDETAPTPEVADPASDEPESAPGGDEPTAEAPAPAEEPDLVIEVENTTFPEGDWLDGIHVTGSGFVPGIEAGVSIRAGEGTLTWQLVEVAPDGTIDVVIVPVDSVKADTPDRPKLMVQGSQMLEDYSVFYSNEVQLTITSSAVPAPPAEEPAPEQPAAPADEEAAAGEPVELAETGFDAVGSALVALVLVAAGGLALARRRVESTR